MNVSKLKYWLYNFVLGSMIFYIVTSTMSGIITSGEVLHWLGAYAVFTLLNLLAEHTLKFLTLPTNFFTYILASTLLTLVSFYIISIFLPGIRFGPSVLDPVSIGIISINPVTLSSTMTMVVGALFSGFFWGLFYWLSSD